MRPRSPPVKWSPHRRFPGEGRTPLRQAVWGAAAQIFQYKFIGGLIKLLVGLAGCRLQVKFFPYQFRLACRSVWGRLAICQGLQLRVGCRILTVKFLR